MSAPSGRRGRPALAWGLAATGAAVLAIIVAVPLVAERQATAPTFTPTAVVTPTAPAAASPSATASAIAVDPNRDRIWVYFSRDGLPPLGAYIGGIFDGGSAEGRILSRLNELHRAGPDKVPTGASNPFASLGALTPTSQGGTQRSFGLGVRVQGDVATVEFDQDFSSIKSGQGQALLQQIVYTVSDESGVRRVFIKEKGKPSAVIDQLVIDKPLAREDVFGYAQPGTIGIVRGFGSREGARDAKTAWSVDQVAPGLARFAVTIDQQRPGPTDPYPDFDVQLERNDESLRPDLGKWRLVVRVYGVVDRTTVAQRVDRSPLRVVERTVAAGPTPSASPSTAAPMIYELGLDDARPWRTALAFDPIRIVVDIGGVPSTMDGENAVYSPRPRETVGRSFTVSGIEHNFEAHVDIRVRDSGGRVVLRTGTTGTNCCEPGGTFDARVDLPAGVGGSITLEVYEGSQRDGTDTKVIAIPLTVGSPP